MENLLHFFFFFFEGVPKHDEYTKLLFKCNVYLYERDSDVHNPTSKVLRTL